MKNKDKTVFVITLGYDDVGVFTNIKIMFESLEALNKTGTCDSKTIWKDFPSYTQCLKLKKKQRNEGYLFSLTLYPIWEFSSIVSITETYLNRGFL